MEASFLDERGRDAFQSFSLFVQNLQIQESDLEPAGEWLVEKRISQTLQGRDFEGLDFAPYSPQYGTRKKDSRVTLRGKGKGPHMLDALTYQIPEPGRLDVGIFDNPELAERARIQNEGAEIRTRIGGGLEGFKLHPGRKKPKGKKSSLIIPARRWLGATSKDLEHMQEMIAKSALERAGKA